MKSKLLLTGLVFVGLTSKAQFGEKGQRLISAGLGASYTGTTGSPSNTNNVSRLNINFSLGKFSKQHVLTQFTVYGGLLDNELDDVSNYYTTKGHNVGAAFSKTYFKPIVKNLFVGLGGSVGVNYNKSKYTTTATATSDDTKRYGISLGLAPSLSYQFSKRFVANLSPGNSFLQLSYLYTDTKRKGMGINTTTSKQQGVDLSAGFWSAPLQNLSISFSYLLKNK